MTATKYDAILFDFDGVLVDSEPLHFACWRDVAARLNLRMDWEWYQRHAVGVADREMVVLVCEANARPDQSAALFALFDEKKRLFAERILLDLPMPASVGELLRELSAAHLPIAVVSSSFRAEILPALVAAGVRDLIGTIVCGDDVQNLKPHPEPYLTAARRLAASNPIVVEDSDTGAAAGIAAGFRVVRVASASETAPKLRAALGF